MIAWFRARLTTRHEKKYADIRKILKRNRDLFNMLSLKLKNSANETLVFDELIEGMIPIYDTRFTASEIRDIIKFQKTKTGQKVIRYSSEMSTEILQYIFKVIQRSR